MLPPISMTLTPPIISIVIRKRLLITSPKFDLSAVTLYLSLGLIADVVSYVTSFLIEPSE